MNSPKKILIVQLRRIGDVLLTTTVPRALKAHFPRARVDFLAESPCNQVLEGNPDIDRIVVYDPRHPIAEISRIRAEGYDWVLDFLSNPRSALLTLVSGAAVKAGWGQVGLSFLYNTTLRQYPGGAYVPVEKAAALEALGVPLPGDILPLVRVPADKRKKGAAFIDPRKSPGPLIGLAPFSRRLTRQWPAGKFASLGKSLVSKLQASLFIAWGPGEKKEAENLASEIGPRAWALPETPHLLDLAALLEPLDLVVTNCNGPKHLATAVGNRTVTIFGSSDPVAWSPPDESRHAKVLPAQPRCGSCDPDSCPRCLEAIASISEEKVFEEVEKLLSSSHFATKRPKTLP